MKIKAITVTIGVLHGLKLGIDIFSIPSCYVRAEHEKLNWIEKTQKSKFSSNEIQTALGRNLKPKKVQLGSSSRAIHWGAYFSAVFGRKFNPTTVLRPSQPLACYWMVFSPPSVTFVLSFRSLLCSMELFKRISSKTAKMDFSPV